MPLEPISLSSQEVEGSRPAAPPVRREPPEEVVEVVEAGAEENQNPPGTMLFHAIFLTLSTVVILLAFFLRTEGETVVTIPFLDAPLPPLCLFQHFTGFDCPGCGLTRCFISVAHGRFQNAWYYNPGGIALFFFVAAQIPYRAVQIVRIRRGLPELSVARFQWLIWIVVVLMFFPWLWKTASRLLGWV